MITTMAITGMTCKSCVRHVDEALRGVDGVTAVEVSLAEGRARVVHAAEASTEALIAAVTAAGYDATPTS